MFEDTKSMTDWQCSNLSAPKKEQKNKKTKGSQITIRKI